MRVDSSIGDEPARIFCCDEDSERPKTVDARSCRRIDEQHVDLTGSVMFEASVDLRRRFPFHWSTCDVGALSHVATSVDDRDPPERIVGMTISAAVGRWRVCFPADASIGEIRTGQRTMLHCVVFRDCRLW